MKFFQRIPGCLGISLLALVATFASHSSVSAASSATSEAMMSFIGHPSRSLFGSYLAGRFARGQRDMKAAAEFYRNALLRDPNNKKILKEAFLSEVATADWKRATTLADEVVKLDAEDRTAHIVIAARALRDGDYKTADHHFSKAAVGPIGELAGTIARAWVRMGQRKPDEAFALLDKLNQAEWARYYRGYHRALIADLAGRGALAKKTYSKLVQDGPRTQRLLFAYASFAANAGDKRLARQILTKRIRKRRQDALILALYADLQAGKPIGHAVSSASEGVAELFYGLGEALTREGGIDVGTMYLQIALYLKPDFPAAMVALASAYESLKKYGVAIKTYNRVPASSPLAFGSVVRKAINFDELKRLDEAKSVLTGLLDDLNSKSGDQDQQVTSDALPPRDDRNAQVRFAQTQLKELGLYAGPVDGLLGPQTIRAIKAFQGEQGLSRDGVVGPQTIGAMANVGSGFAELARRERQLLVLRSLGNILRANKKYEEATQYYSKAIALIDRPEQKDWNQFYARGVCFERLNQWPKAERDLQKALELYPNQPLVLNYLGYSWVDQNHNLPEAMKLIRKAVKIKPDDGYFVDSLGWAYYRQRNYRAATQYLERAVELRPDDPVINDHLGDAYWNVGRKLEAQYQWTQALSLDPEPEDAAEIKLKIAKALEEQRETKIVRKVSTKAKVDEPEATGEDVDPFRQ